MLLKLINVIFKEEIKVEVNSIIKMNIEKYTKDPVFMALVKKYAEESEKFNKNKSKIDKEHDKIFKRVFLNKKETARFISKVIGRKVKSSELIASQNSFVTAELKYREADIVYKLKDKNIVFLIEHQTRVDYRMAYRILNYQIEIMRANEVENPKKEDKECLVIPIVLYTGKGKWTAKKHIKEIQEKLFKENVIEKVDLGTLGYYTLVDVNDFTKEELLNEEGILSKIMPIEKERNTKELVKTMLEINKRVKEGKDKKIVYDMMSLALDRKFKHKKAEEIMKKIIKEGSDYMLAVEKMILEENEMLRNEGINEGKYIMCVNMLKMGYSIEIVSKVSGLSIKELEKLKKNIENRKNNL